MKRPSFKTIIFGVAAMCTGVVIGVISTISTLSEEMSDIKATKTEMPKTPWESFKDWMLGNQ